MALTWLDSLVLPRSLWFLWDLLVSGGLKWNQSNFGHLRKILARGGGVTTLAQDFYFVNNISSPPLRIFNLTWSTIGLAWSPQKIWRRQCRHVNQNVLTDKNVIKTIFGCLVKCLNLNSITWYLRGGSQASVTVHSLLTTSGQADTSWATWHQR